MKRFLILLSTSLIHLLFSYKVFAQEASFVLPENACLNERFILSNDDNNNEQNFQWDFCPTSLADLSSVEDVISLEGANYPNAVTIVYDSLKWYGFVSNRGNNKLLRLDFGNSLDNVPQVVDLGDFGGILKVPKNMAFFKEGNEWYALMINIGNKSLLRFHFPSGLGTSPNVVNLGNVGSFNAPFGLDIGVDNGNIVVLVTNFLSDNISLLNFGNSITNVPAASDRLIIGAGAGLSQPFGVKIKKEGGDWFGLVSSFKNGKVFKMDFGSSLFSNPLFSEVSTLSNPTEITFLDEASNQQALIVGRSQGLQVISFSDGLQSMPTSTDNIGNYGVLTDVRSISLAKENGNWKGFIAHFTNNNLYKLNFSDNCEFVSAEYSVLVNPVVSYSQPGTYPITLTAYDEFGNRDDTTQFVTVTADQAPSIAFQSDQCFGGTSTLTATADQALSSANWSITDEDNITTTRTGQTVTYDFPTPGTYEVTLEVESANGCGNRLTKDITIYEPPVPSFTAPTGQICSNAAVDFTNATDARGADDLITYRWFVTDPSNNETLVSEEANPAITFTTGGSNTVRFEAGIPGCTETFEQTIDILQGPTVSFTVPTVCQSNAVTFENQTVGANITGYFWEFGDGGTYSSVTAESPSYTFATPGTYPVSLRVTNAQGCQNVYQQSVTVYSQPSVSFSSEVACAGSPTQFTDASTAGANANVSAWQWDFGDGIGTASTRNPTYAYRQAGTYAVKLITTSTAGCVDSTVQTVTVKSAVDVGFAALRQCPTEARPLNVLLSDTSVAAAGETIDRWFWTVNGNNFVSAEVEYAFPAPGDYPVSLTVFTTSGCNATVQRIVSVTTSPTVAFTTVGSCTGKPVVFQGEVDAPGWGELSYAWEFVGPNGEAAGNAATANPEVAFETPGPYAVTLTVQTDGGCSFSTTRSVAIAATPVATFTAAPDYGGTPLEVSFVNATTDATSYAWDFGGRGTSEEAEPTFTFTAVGTYVVTLLATNAAGCASTTQQTVEVVLPVQDLRLDDFTVADSPTGDGQQLVLTISNRGTRVASGVTVTVDLDETLTVEERRTEPLLPGQTVVYVTKFRLPTQQRNQQRPLRYLCARIAATDADFAEAQLDNNRNCLSLNEQLNVEPPFPNPASEQLRISVILPEAEAVSLRLLNQDGRVVRTHRQEATLVGLNTFLLDVQGLPVGAYLLQVSYQAEQRQFRVAVRR